MWLNFTVGGGLCDAIVYFDNVLGTSLCQTEDSLSKSLGTLEGLCPGACGLCQDSDSDTYASFKTIYMQQGVDLYLGLIDYPIIGKIVTQEVLSCSSIAAGSTTPATLPPPSDFGNDSPEQVYVFESTVSQHVSFSTCDSADYNSLIRVLDAYFSEMDNNDDGEGCGEYTSYLEIFLEANQQFFVVVEGSAVTEWGSFNLSVAC